MAIRAEPERPRPAVRIPGDALAGEIELAIAYTIACNLEAAPYFLLTGPGGRRRDFAEAIAAMLAERAGKGLSGMSLDAGSG